jgi:hypothetical protein
MVIPDNIGAWLEVGKKEPSPETLRDFRESIKRHIFYITVAKIEDHCFALNARGEIVKFQKVSADTFDIFSL